MKLKQLTIRRGWPHKGEPDYVAIVDLEGEGRKLTTPLTEKATERLISLIRSDLELFVDEARMEFIVTLREAFPDALTQGDQQ